MTASVDHLNPSEDRTADSILADIQDRLEREKDQLLDAQRVVLRLHERVSVIKEFLDDAEKYGSN